MVNTQYAIHNTQYEKSKGQVILEYILFALCLCVIALRATLTEGLSAQSTNQANFADTVYSLSISAVVILSFVVWFIWSFCSRRFVYRFTTIEIGLCLFTIAAVIATVTASNKRAAITDFIMLIAPLLCAVLLIQILDSHSKIKLLLIVITALGVVSAYQCAEQFFFSNQMTIDQYEQAPQSILRPLGIEPGSFRQMVFEHRLYSRGVPGFFTTSNSAGSFALLASFAGVALFIEKVKNRKSKSSAQWQLVLCGIVVAAVIFGLAITRSKGAIIASLIAAAVFIALLCFGSWLKMHKKPILIACLLLVVAGGSAVIVYGLAHDRLPGGNSMLVRWQYWRASARMYADHPFAGVGPANFTHFYPHYKPASALESVADPHNFLLSILTQYGPLGLIGFLALVFVPLWKVPITPAKSLPQAHRPQPPFIMLAAIYLIVVSIALRIIRPMMLPILHAVSIEERKAAVFMLYMMPVIVFILGFLLLTPTGRTKTKNAIRATSHESRITSLTAAALFCACLGLLIHNLIDFAIFEPGVFTAFWATMAALIASDFQQKKRKYLILKPAASVKALAAAGGLLITFVLVNFTLIPPVKSTAKIQQAQQAVTAGRFQRAHNLLAAAAEDDRLSPLALNRNARLYLQRFHTSGSQQADLLLNSEQCLIAAIQRDKADYKNFERLTEVYTLLAQTAVQQQKTDWLHKALDSANRAVELYPGLGRLRFQLAKIAEKLGKNDIAITQFNKAIDIEDSFRRQFQLMYPNRQLFSRLGKEKYKNAKQQIKHLSEQ